MNLTDIILGKHQAQKDTSWMISFIQCSKNKAEEPMLLKIKGQWLTTGNEVTELKDWEDMVHVLFLDLGTGTWVCSSCERKCIQLRK